MMSKYIFNKIYIFSILLFLLFISSLKPWFFWHNENILPLICLPFSLFFIDKKINISNKKILSIILIIVCFFYSSINGNFNNLIFNLLKGCLFINLVLLNEERQYRILSIIINFFSYSIFLLFIIWIINLNLKILPSYEVTYDGNFYYFKNYTFYLESISQYLVDDDNFLYRFRGIYLEPGHIAMIISFLLFIRKYEVNRINIMLFIVLISTFSLAGFVLSFLGYFLQRLKDIKKRNGIIIFLFVFLIIYFLSVNYRDGHNMFNELIFSRLEFDNEKLIKGNNRNSQKIDLLFSDMFIKRNYFFGYSSNFLENINSTGSAGIKVFIIQYGFLGIILNFIMYYSFLLINKNYLSSMLFILFFINFFQRSYPEWPAFMIIFIFANSYINKNN